MQRGRGLLTICSCGCPMSEISTKQLMAPDNPHAQVWAVSSYVWGRCVTTSSCDGNSENAKYDHLIHERVQWTVRYSLNFDILPWKELVQLNGFFYVRHHCTPNRVRRFASGLLFRPWHYTNLYCPHERCMLAAVPFSLFLILLRISIFIYQHLII